ncbi:hypothetical protein CsSME_00052117 [Camellia sinensis var. sinensis]
MFLVDMVSFGICMSFMPPSDYILPFVSRDGFAKTIYYRLFDWLVDTINVSIGQDPNLNDIQLAGMFQF